MNEAHVEHAVCFVENEHFESIEFHGPLIDEIKKSTRGGDEDVRSVLESLQLWAGGDTAEDDV